MKTPLCLLVFVPVLLFMSGCAHRSYHPWLDEDHLVDDDRVAGVWQGIDAEEVAGLWQGMDAEDNETDETELFFVRRVEGSLEADDDDDEGDVPAGYYSVTWIENDSVEEPATLVNLHIRPKRLFAGLYKIDSVLLLQVWGNTLEQGHPLVAPMHVIYKARLEDDMLYLHDLELDDMEEADMVAEGLLFESHEENPIVFFSPTEAMTEFLRKHLNEEGFFHEEPTLVLKRLRDLSIPVIEGEFEGNEVEELEPVQ